MKQKYLPWLILIAVSFGLYVNTIPHEFALDDKMVILKTAKRRKLLMAKVIYSPVI